MQSEPPLPVEPALLERKGGSTEHSLDHFHPVFVAVFRLNALSRTESDDSWRHRQGNALRSCALQIDLHPRCVWIPFGDMTKRIQIEVRAELAIDSPQNVLVEFGRNPSRIIVSRDQKLCSLDHVRAQEQGIARRQ